MAVLTLTMIFIYAPSLGAIVLAALFVYVLLRIVFFHKLRRSSLDLMVARAREGTTFIETVRAIQSIKLFGREAERCAVWMNHHAELTSFPTTRRWKSAARNQATFLVGRRRSRLPSTRKEKMSLPKFWRQRRRRRQRLPRVDQEVALQAIVRSASTRSRELIHKKLGKTLGLSTMQLYLKRWGFSLCACGRATPQIMAWPPPTP
jgi:ABC-type multidrug transport system fused ATPase/permease subunit